VGQCQHKHKESSAVLSNLTPSAPELRLKLLAVTNKLPPINYNAFMKKKDVEKKCRIQII
jgi:hypothetical protein